MHHHRSAQLGVQSHAPCQPTQQQSGPPRGTLCGPPLPQQAPYGEVAAAARGVGRRKGDALLTICCRAKGWLRPVCRDWPVGTARPGLGSALAPRVFKRISRKHATDPCSASPETFLSLFDGFCIRIHKVHHHQKQGIRALFVPRGGGKGEPGRDPLGPRA